MKFCPKCYSDRVFGIFIKKGRKLGFHNEIVNNEFIQTSDDHMCVAKISHLLFHCGNCLHEWRERCKDYY